MTKGQGLGFVSGFLLVPTFRRNSQLKVSNNLIRSFPKDNISPCEDSTVGILLRGTCARVAQTRSPLCASHDCETKSGVYLVLHVC